MKRGAILLVLVSLAVAGAAPATAHGAVSCHRINAMGTGVGQDLGGGQVQVTAQVIGGGLLHGTYQSSFQIVGFSFPVASFEGPSVFTVTGGTLTTQVTGTLDVTNGQFQATSTNIYDQSTHILTTTETAAGSADTGSTYCSVYAVNYGDGKFGGWQMQPLQATDVGLLEAALGPNQLWIAAYCDDVFGYLPSARVLREGGYETRGLYSAGVGYFDAKTEDIIIEQVKKLATEAGRKTAATP